MDPELLKAFEKVISFYRTGPKYLDVVGTELFEKMSELEGETVCFAFNVERWRDGFIEIFGNEYYRCFLCNKFMNESYISEFDVQLDEKTIQFMVPGNDDLYDRLIKFQKSEGCVHLCEECCERHYYNSEANRFEFDVYSWINRVVERKPDEICEAERLLLKYYKFKGICKAEELFLSYYYEPKEISRYEEDSLSYAHKKGRIHKAENLLLDYYHKSGRIYEAEKLLEYRNLREIREVEKQSNGHKSEEISKRRNNRLPLIPRDSDYGRYLASLGIEISESSDSEDYESIEYESIDFDSYEDYENVEDIQVEN